LIDVLNEMTIDKSVVILVSNSYDGLTRFVDEDYGTKYDIVNECPNLSGANIDVALLDLPNINRFISIKEDIIAENKKTPVKLELNCSESNCVELYYLPTNEFATPDVKIRATICLPLSMQTVEAYEKTTLYFSSLLAEINHENYMCTTANYDVNVMFESGKLNIEIFGNYGKIKEICEFLVESLLNKNLITEKIFNTSVYGFEMASTNAVLTPPYKRINNFFHKNMCTKFYDNYDTLPVLKSENITLESVKSVINELLTMSVCTMLVSGNCTTELAKEVAEIFGKFVPNKSCTFDRSVYDTYPVPLQKTKTIIKKA
jgi:secreted Zn-dependent insulinase-like peptidase